MEDNKNLTNIEVLEARAAEWQAAFEERQTRTIMLNIELTRALQKNEEMGTELLRLREVVESLRDNQESSEFTDGFGNVISQEN